MPTFAPQLSNMQHDEVLAHLHQVKAALQKERDEDFQQYKSYFSRNNINHRKESGVTWYPIVISNTGIGLGEYLYIDIERTSLKGQPHQLAGGKQAALFSNNHTAATPLVGTIKTLGPDKIRLSLNVDELPDWCDDGKLGVNLLFDENSYREMHIALDKVLEAEHSPLSKLRDVLLGAKAPTFKTEKEVVQLHPNNALAVSHLNPSQQAAVNQVLQANEVALIKTNLATFEPRRPLHGVFRSEIEAARPQGQRSARKNISLRRGRPQPRTLHSRGRRTNPILP